MREVELPISSGFRCAFFSASLIAPMMNVLAFSFFSSSLTRRVWDPAALKSPRTMRW